jgi:hypothetical protein
LVVLYETKVDVEGNMMRWLELAVVNTTMNRLVQQAVRDLLTG